MISSIFPIRDGKCVLDSLSLNTITPRVIQKRPKTYVSVQNLVCTKKFHIDHNIDMVAITSPGLDQCQRFDRSLSSHLNVLCSAYAENGFLSEYYLLSYHILVGGKSILIFRSYFKHQSTYYDGNQQWFSKRFNGVLCGWIESEHNDLRYNYTVFWIDSLEHFILLRRYHLKSRFSLHLSNMGYRCTTENAINY